MLSDELLEILVCPECRGDLEYDRNADTLVCNECRLIYDVKDDIPVMLVEEATKF